MNDDQKILVTQLGNQKPSNRKISNHEKNVNV